MTDKPYIPHGMTLRELLEEMAADEGLTADLREECRQTAKKIPAKPRGEHRNGNQG